MNEEMAKILNAEIKSKLCLFQKMMSCLRKMESLKERYF